jgi:DNA-binding transcriptional regulator LsrR (DeoR family)
MSERKRPHQVTPLERAKILALLASDDPPTYRVIIQRFGIARNTVSRLVAQARKVSCPAGS